MAELDDIEDAMVRHPDPVVTASDLADEVDEDVTSRHVLDLLRLLERAGDVESKKIGARAVAWWHVDRVCAPRVPPEDHPDQSGLDDAARPAGPPESDVGREPGENDEAASLDEDLDALDLPGQGDVLEERQAAVRACYQYLRDEGRARKAEFVDDVYSDYEAGYASSGGWWNTIGKKGLAQLAERRDDVRAPAGEGAHQWRFDG